MPFELGKYPRGMTGVLGLRASGETPRSMADQLVSVVDATPFYLLDTREFLLGTQKVGVAVGVNDIPSLTVPPGQVWYVWEYAIACTLGAGTAIDCAPSVVLDGLGLTSLAGGYVAGAALQQIRGRADPGCLWGPGSVPGVFVRSVTGALNVDSAVIITRLKI
jgi:hypothetical protein